MLYEQKMDALNSQWKIKHQMENTNSNVRTLYHDVLQENFKEDGVIEPKKYFETQERILFLMEESNDKDSGDEFWFQKMYRYYVGKERENKNVPEPKEKRTFMKYVSRFHSMYQIAVGKEFNIDKGQRVKWLEQCAYMNLNKRGGGSTADLEIIRNYIIYYREEIKREIEITAPTTIFFCCKDFNPTKWNGEQRIGILLEYWNAFWEQRVGEKFIRNDLYKFFYMPHPGSRKSNKDFCNQINLCIKMQNH